MKFIVTLIFCLLSFNYFSQNTLNFERTYSDTLPDRLKIEPFKIRDHIYNGIPSYSKTGKYERMTYVFADEVSSQISNLLTGGYVYNDWNELEIYVNEILQKIIPEGLKKDSTIHAYIYQKGSVNAFMTPSGQFFIHIGLISRCNDEATLAAVLAHELAHYYKQHSLKSYIQSKLGNFNNGIINNDDKRNVMSVKQEVEADSLAMIWIKNSQYSLMGILKSNKMLEREEQRQLSRLENEWKPKHSTHPQSKKRVENFHKFYRKNKNLHNKLFLVNEELFFKYKKVAKQESLRCLLEDLKYYDCLELAFKFHLIDPDNETYIYYLMESIRKICYINNETWDQNFITNRYYDTVRVDGVKRKHKINKGLFESIDFDLLPISQEEAKYIKAKFYWQGPKKFNTYNEAFEFYNKVGIALNCSECVLTNALSITNNKKLRDKLLHDYINQDNIKHKEYAEKLINEEVITKLPNKKMLIFSQFIAGIRQGNDRIKIQDLSEDTTGTLENIFDSLKVSFPQRNFLYLPNLKYTNISDYKILKTLEDLTFRNSLYLETGAAKVGRRPSQVKLHILEPNFLKIFNKYHINEIEFMNCIYTESRKKDNSLDWYKNVRNLSYKDFFERPKCTKSIHAITTSLREIKNKRLQVRAYGSEVSLKFKPPSYDQIIAELRYKIRYKEKVARDLDYSDEKKINK
jgi:hypothetical protein